MSGEKVGIVRRIDAIRGGGAVRVEWFDSHEQALEAGGVSRG